MDSYICEYIWLDGCNNLRSKIRVIKSEFEKYLTLNMIPEWNFDGSSTNQTNSEGNTEVILKPVKMYKDKYKLISNCSSCREYFFVLCETYNIDGNNPTFNNKIAHLRKSDSIAVWGYDPATGVIDFEGAPFMPVNVLHRVDGTGGN